MSRNNTQHPINYGYCPRCFFYPINLVDKHNPNNVGHIEQMQNDSPNNNPYYTGLFISPLFSGMPVDNNNPPGNEVQTNNFGTKSRKRKHAETNNNPFPLPVKIKVEKDCEVIEQKRRETKLVKNRGRKKKETKEKSMKPWKNKKPRSKPIEGWYSKRYGKRIFNKFRIMIPKLSKQQIADAINDEPLSFSPPPSPPKPSVFPIQLWNLKNVIPLKPLTSGMLSQVKPKPPITIENTPHLDPYYTPKQSELGLIIGTPKPADVMIEDSDIKLEGLKINNLSTNESAVIVVNSDLIPESSKINDTTTSGSLKPKILQELLKMDKSTSSVPKNLANLYSDSKDIMIDNLTISDDPSDLANTDEIQALSEKKKWSSSTDASNLANCNHLHVSPKFDEETPENPLKLKKFESNSTNSMVLNLMISDYAPNLTNSNKFQASSENKNWTSTDNKSNMANFDLLQESLEINDSTSSNPLNLTYLQSNSNDSMMIDYNISHLTTRIQELKEFRHKTFPSNLENFGSIPKDAKFNVVNSDLIPESLDINELTLTNDGSNMANPKEKLKDLMFVDLATSDNDSKLKAASDLKLEGESSEDIFLLDVDLDEKDNVLPSITSSQEDVLLKEIDNAVNVPDEPKIETNEVPEGYKTVQGPILFLAIH